MAARLNPKHDEKTRLKIQTSQLLNRLQGFVLGEKDAKTKKPIVMSDGQIRAALGLLKKSLPDLQSTEITSDITMTRYVVRAPAMAKSAEEWEKQHRPGE